ncbi:hypothetical protein MD484_g787, partial [Candolleomyces efflorescens]
MSSATVANTDNARIDLKELILREGLAEEDCCRLSEEAYDLLREALQPYGLDTGELLSKMKDCKAYISGSFPLSIIHARVKSNDLDIYVQEEGMAEIVEFLVSKGYNTPVEMGSQMTTYKEGEDTDNDGGFMSNGIAKVMYTKRQGGGVVNVVATKCPPIQVIPLFHSTVVMNYIAYHGIVMLYPKTTLNNTGSINCGGKITAKMLGCIDKYKERGFTLTRSYPNVNTSKHRCGVNPYCPQTIRHLQDRGVLHIPFPDYSEEELGKLRFDNDTNKFVWQLANVAFCKEATADKHGFSLVDTSAIMNMKKRK